MTHDPTGGAAPPPALDAITPDTVDAVLALGQLTFRFAAVSRITRFPDGESLESDTDHTVMLTLIACALAHALRIDVDLGEVAQDCAVHDVVEAYADDTDSLSPGFAARRAEKKAREEAAYQLIAAQFGETLPWLAHRIAQYKSLATRSGRYVWILDKIVPKVTHILNGGATMRRTGMTRAQVADRYARQREELLVHAAEFPELLALHAALVSRLLRVLPADELPAHA